MVPVISQRINQHFNPRPPRGGRRFPRTCHGLCHGISIHAPREGGDTKVFIITNIPPDISIHAPREGGDFRTRASGGGVDISIHAPREGGDPTARASP